jgi:hypothetical protein
MAIRLLPTTAAMALEGSTTYMDCGGSDGWAMPHGYAIDVLSPPAAALLLAEMSQLGDAP